MDMTGVDTGGPAGDAGRLRRLRAVWSLVALLVVVIGATTATLSALAIARGQVQQADRAFSVSSAEAASIVRLAIQHEDDLVVNASAYISSHPNASNAELAGWGRLVRALDRYPELNGFGEVAMVPAAQMPAFTARVTADPPLPLDADGVFRVVPAGVRPYYCLAVLSVARYPERLPAGLDFCALGSGRPDSRDTARSDYTAFSFGGRSELAISAPVYRGGVVPTTVAARRAAFAGWLGVTFVPAVVLDQALRGHPGMAVTLRHGSGNSAERFTSGHAPAGGRTATFDVGNGWTAEVTGAAVAGGLLHHGSAVVQLVWGIVGSALFGLLLFVLATGRARALLLVQLKTDALRHLASHDPLTGLANRALILDRLDRALARAQRSRDSVSVLFLDLDGFKQVNDTYGHAAGDELLREVARRLVTTLRGGDTVGRLGGDEFVVLVDGDSLDAGAESVAQRIRDALAAPVRLGPELPEVAVRASIGIAVGTRATADELLRDADVALYEAKNAGRDRYVLFASELGADGGPVAV